MSRTYARDALGRFARTGASTAKATAKATAPVRKAYVSGSAKRHLAVGPVGQYKTVTIGADFATSSGRGVRIKASAGYHGRPDRRYDVTPRLDKPAKTATVTVTQRAPTGTRVASPPRTRSNAGRRLR